MKASGRVFDVALAFLRPHWGTLSNSVLKYVWKRWTQIEMSQIAEMPKV